jgi:hypothetical protein
MCPTNYPALLPAGPRHYLPGPSREARGRLAYNYRMLKQPSTIPGVLHDGFSFAGLKTVIARGCTLFEQ